MDPGWRFSWKTIPSGVAFPWTMEKRGRDTSEDELLLIRNGFVGMCAIQLVVGLVAVVLGDMTTGPEPIALSAGLVGVPGVASVVASTRVGTINCSSPTTVALSYRTRFLSRSVFANVPGLVGFGLGTSMGPWWIYFLGAALTAVGLAMLAPSASKIAGEDADLQANGCSHSLLASLLNPAAADHT